MCIASDPAILLRDVAAPHRLSERTAYGLVADLAEGGYIVKERQGRRNRYRIQADQPCARVRRLVTGHSARPRCPHRAGLEGLAGQSEHMFAIVRRCRCHRFRAALRVRLQGAYDSATCLQPWSTVPSRREDYLALLQMVMELDEATRNEVAGRAALGPNPPAQQRSPSSRLRAAMTSHEAEVHHDRSTPGHPSRPPRRLVDRRPGGSRLQDLGLVADETAGTDGGAGSGRAAPGASVRARSRSRCARLQRLTCTPKTRSLNTSSRPAIKCSGCTKSAWHRGTRGPLLSPKGQVEDLAHLPHHHCEIGATEAGLRGAEPGAADDPLLVERPLPCCREPPLRGGQHRLTEVGDGRDPVTAAGAVPGEVQRTGRRGGTSVAARRPAAGPGTRGEAGPRRAPLRGRAHR